MSPNVSRPSSICCAISSSIDSVNCCLLAQHWHKNRPRLAPAPALRLVEINWCYRANARDCKFRKNRLFIRLQGQVCREQDRGSVTQDCGDSYAQRGPE